MLDAPFAPKGRQNTQTMLYLSQLLGTPVENAQDTRIGRIVDVLLPAKLVGSDEPAYPSTLLIDSEEEQRWRVPLRDVSWFEGALRLNTPLQQLTRASRELVEEPDEISLAQEVLDKQIIDIKRKKAVRVNDVCLDDSWRILGIDNSAFGLVRRLAPSWLLGSKGRDYPSVPLPWQQIELIRQPRPDVQDEKEGLEEEEAPHVQRILSGHLAEMHPADIAEIVHQLTPGQGARLIEGLDDETAAATMEEIDTERQSHILENIEPERAADILQTMGPDEAADLIARLPEEQAQELLHRMTPEESEEVQELLEYADDSAGGLMTTDFLALTQTRTVQEALEAVRTNAREHDLRAAYVYCVENEEDEESPLVGVVSLWELLIGGPTQQLHQFMEVDLISVVPETGAHEVAEKIAKYNLLAVPVINAQRALQGIVTVDDALDVLLPPERRRKPKRMY